MNSNRIFIASNNQDKIREVQDFFNYQRLKTQLILPPIKIDVEEDGLTLKENAYKKTKFLYDKGYFPCFADDTGLFLPHLDGIPGVKSSRFAGDKATYEDNRRMLLEILREVPFEKRYAYFKTVICFIDLHGRNHFFEGTVNGFIILEERGENKFGYDPIFLCPELGLTFGELDLTLKNKISHRAKALSKFTSFLLNESLHF